MVIVEQKAYGLTRNLVGQHAFLRDARGAADSKRSGTNIKTRLIVRAEPSFAGEAPACLGTGRIPCLDGLRGLSIAMVILGHAALAGGFPLPSDPVLLARPGHLGVSVFFTISGFLITTLLVREWTRTGSVSLSQFYRRRSLRILPAYVVFLLVLAGLSQSGSVSISGLEWASALTYTVNFVREPSWVVGHVWSLSVEEQFYLVWPLLLLYLSPAGARRAVLVYLLCAPAVRIAIWLFLPDRIGLIETLTPLRLDAIAAGCLLALAAQHDGFRARLAAASTRNTPWLVLGGLAASVAVSQTISAYGVTLSYSFEALCIASLIWFLVTQPESRLGRLLETRPLIIGGTLSYSLYLWQQLFLNPEHHGIVTSFPLNVFLAVGVAAVSYYAIESPFLRMKDRKGNAAVRLRVNPAPAPRQIEVA